MKGKIRIVVVLVVAIAFVGWLFLLSPEDGAGDISAARVDRERSDALSLDQIDRTVDRPTDDQPGRSPKFVATPLPRPPDPEVLNKIEYPKFSQTGSGTRGAIRDEEGNVILRATSESPAIAITISPNENLIWVSGGDRKSYIINSKGEEIANLPILPPGRDMLGFGKWVWLDNQRLLGESGVQKFDQNGKLVTCCGSDNVSESRFYVYDLTTGELEEMLLPEALRGKVVNISRVLDSGEILMGHGGDEFGWYQVADLGEER